MDGPMFVPERELARYEIKLACIPECLPELRAWIQEHPALFCESYPPRQVNNIYLDSLAADNLETHLSGVGLRQKLRFRWYGEEHTAASGSLELKCRSGHLGWKRLCVIPRTFDLSRISWHEWMVQVRALADGPAQSWLASVDRPTLINAYRREYFEASEGEVRLTIDHPMLAYDQIAYASPNLLFAVPLASQIVVEIKAGLAQWRRLPDILSRFPLRATRNSKYVRGMQGTLSL
jgi:hypothetical protein